MKGRKTGGGSRKAIPNKATQDMREAFARLLEANTDNIQGWLDRTAQADPHKAVELLLRMAEYTTPRLRSTELKGDQDKPLPVDRHGFRFVLH